MATDALEPPMTSEQPEDGQLLERPRGPSLYVRVVAVNAVIVLLAALLLAVTPVTISFPVAAKQGLALAIGVLVMVLADAAVLRRSLAGLDNVVRRMRTVDVLRPEDRLPETGGPEARALIVGFNAMLDRLEAERRESSGRSLRAVESERRRLGRELHDELGQRLTGILLQLERVREDAPDSLRPVIAAIQEQERAAIDEVGALAWQLGPNILEDLGLLRAIEALVASYNENREGTLNASLPESIPTLSTEVEITIYRIAQEALTNAVRHSGADAINLTMIESGEGLSMSIADNGRGLSRRQGQGAGIRGMRERALLIGGSLHILGSYPTGVNVVLRLSRSLYSE